MTERVNGIIGRALSMFPIAMHDYTFMSNHAHYDVSPGNIENACGFLSYVNRNTALVAKRLTGWKEKVWAHSSIIPIVDDAAAVDRLRYVMSNGVKEGLVASPLDWPGPSGTRALLSGGPVDARWRPLAQRYAEPDDPSFPIHLAPLPCWRDLSPAQRQMRVEQLVREIEDEGLRARRGSPVLGIDALRTRDPFEETELDADHAAPLVHASTKEARDRFMEERADFHDQVRRASKQVRQGPHPYPVGVYPRQPSLLADV
jgi:hypothetical protein